jgi:hypothetical protein
MPTSRSTGSSSDADVLQAVYAQLTAYLGALRDAHGAIHGEEVRALIDHLTDEALAMERKILAAVLKASGRTLQDGY